MGKGLCTIGHPLSCINPMAAPPVAPGFLPWPSLHSAAASENSQPGRSRHLLQALGHQTSCPTRNKHQTLRFTVRPGKLRLGDASFSGGGAPRTTAGPASFLLQEDSSGLRHGGVCHCPSSSPDRVEKQCSCSGLHSRRGLRSSWLSNGAPLESQPLGRVRQLRASFTQPLQKAPI